MVPADAPDFRNVLAFHSCSKRSCMTGFRSGFVAGDPRLIAALARFRPSVGVATPAFVQAAATVALIGEFLASLRLDGTGAAPARALAESVPDS